MSEIDDLKILVDANQNYNVEAHVILHTAIDNERVLRIAGDAVSMSAIRIVSDSVALANSLLSNEVLNRSEGDLVSDSHYTSLNERFLLEWGNLNTVLTDLRVDTNARLTQLDQRIDATNLEIELTELLLRTLITNEIKLVSTRVDALQEDVDKYLVLLQNITLDSTQITLDNGEIIAGAWTILSQAREWDLDIIRSLKKYQANTDDRIDQSLEDIQNQLPNVQQIINEAIEALSQSPVITELDKLIGDALINIDGVSQTVMEHKTQQQQDMINMAQLVATTAKAESEARVVAIKDETDARINSIQRESTVRLEQIRLLNEGLDLEMTDRLEQIKLLNDGLTKETTERIDGDNHAYELIENLKVSSGQDLANVYQQIAVNRDDISANALAVTQLDARLVTAQDTASTAIVNAATALDRANTAVTATTAVAEQVQAINVSIGEITGSLNNKVDVIAFNTLKAEVERVDGVTKSNTESISSITGNIATLDGAVKGNATAIEGLQVTQTSMGDSITQLAQRTTVLESSVGTLNGAVAGNATAIDNIKIQVDKQDKDIKSVSEANTLLTTRVDNIAKDYATGTALNTLKSEVSVIDGLTKTNTESITRLDNSVNVMSGLISGNTTAISALTAKQEQFGDTLNQTVGRVDTLSVQMGDVTKQTNANAIAIADTIALVNKNGTDITALTQSTQNLSVKVDNIKYGGDNLLKKSNVQVIWNPSAPAYPHGKYDLSEAWVQGETYTLTWCVTHRTTGSSKLAVYAGGGLQSVQLVANTAERAVYTAQFVKNAQDIASPIVVFYLIAWDTRPDTIGTIHWAVMSKGASVGVSGWKPSNQDTEDALANTASSEALTNLKAEVSVIDGRVNANANSLLQLTSKVDANQAYIVDNYYTKVATDVVIANQITAFKSTLAVGGRNLVLSTQLPSSNVAGWIFQEKLAKPVKGQVTISFDFTVTSGSGAEGGVGFNYGDEGFIGYSYFWYPFLTTGRHVLTVEVDSQNFSHFGVYSNGNGIVSNLQLEYGNVPTAWRPAPEDTTVGGRNLLLNSDFRKGMQPWNVYAATVTLGENNINNKLTKYAFIRGTIGGLYMPSTAIPYIPQSGETFILSFLARGSGNMLAGFDSDYSDIALTETWKRYTLHLKVNSPSNVILYLGGATSIDVALPKLEVGNIATEWTPAPEDNIQDIEAQATAVNSISTQVQNIDGRLSATASQVLTLESFTTSIVNGAIAGNGYVTIDLTSPSYGQDMWFPVLASRMAVEYRSRFRLTATLGTSGVPYWATHAAGFSCTYDWETNGSGWGGMPVRQVVNVASSGFSNGIPPVLGIGQDTESSQALFYLRGGGNYILSLPSILTHSVCPPDGTLTAQYGYVYSPTPYNASLVTLSTSDKIDASTVKLQQVNEVQDGIRAVSTVSVNNNGFISGYGLISQLVNGVVTSAFGVNADYFYVGTSSGNQKKPFMVLTIPQVIGGVSYPAGTWMDVALIANATIGTAHIQDASITNAKIANLDAAKITTGILNADRIAAGSITADKIVLGDSTNLWRNELFAWDGARPQSNRSAWLAIPELRGGGVLCWGRDHAAPYATRVVVKPGEQIYFEYTARHSNGPYRALSVGMWFYNDQGVTTALMYVGGEGIASLGGGWYRYRSTQVVPANATTGVLFIQIEQGEQEANPTYHSVGDLIMKKVNGGELIVNGSITSDKLVSNTVSAMFANFGTWTSYSADGAKVVQTGAKREIYAPNGNLVMRDGWW